MKKKIPAIALIIFLACVILYSAISQANLNPTEELEEEEVEVPSDEIFMVPEYPAGTILGLIIGLLALATFSASKQMNLGKRPILPRFD